MSGVACSTPPATSRASDLEVTSATTARRPAVAVGATQDLAQRLPDGVLTLFRTASGLATPQRLVVREPGAWVQLWNGVRRHTGTVGAGAPAVDFAQHVAVIVGSGQKPTGGFAIVIDSVQAGGQAGLPAGTVVVHVRELEPGRRPTGPAVSTPAHVVLIPRGAVSEAPDAVRFAVRAINTCP
jgi:hypothetical protein